MAEIPLKDLPLLKGRITTKPRPFHEVVGDLRHAVFSVIRLRPDADGFRAKALGSGFFIGPRLFLTCHHVVNSSKEPHETGDSYELVNSLGMGGVVYGISQGVIGKNMHLFPDRDAALLEMGHDNAYAALDFRDLAPGIEIGVAGYPLPRLGTTADGTLRYDGLTYRVAKSVVTAITLGSVNHDGGPQTAPLPRIEVNFLFVAGNSGGPVFDSQTGRVIGFVHGYQTYRMRERVVNTDLQDLPPEVPTKYVENIHAIYSLAFAVSCLRDEIEKMGVHV